MKQTIHRTVLSPTSTPPTPLPPAAFCSLMVADWNTQEALLD